MLTRRLSSHLLLGMNTNTGENLKSLSDGQPVMLIFLRHFGCTFCREALSDIAKKRDSIENGGTQLVFVHMTNNAIADTYFENYGMENVTHISDPNCRFYQAFGLTKCSFNQLFGLQSWVRGFSAGIVRQHWIGKQLGDGFQMPGVFTIQDCEVKAAFVHKLASDRPDYEKLVECCAELA